MRGVIIMKYEKIYNDFIKDRKAKEPAYLHGLRYDSVRTKLRRMFGDKQGLETHHIVEKHNGGTDDPSNIVTLTVREHIFAHLLLAKWKNDSKSWAGLWAVTGMPRKDRSIKNYFVNKKMLIKARTANKDFCVGEKSALADLKVYTIHNVRTGETVKANRHNMPITSLQFSDYLVSWDNMKPTKKWPVQFAGGEWFMVGHNFKSIQEAKNYEKKLSLVRSENSKRTARRGKDNPQSVKVKNLDLNKVYLSVVDAVNDLKLPKSARFKIGEVCRGQRKQTAGYRWAYA